MNFKRQRAAHTPVWLASIVAVSATASTMACAGRTAASHQSMTSTGAVNWAAVAATSTATTTLALSGSGYLSGTVGPRVGSSAAVSSSERNLKPQLQRARRIVGRCALLRLQIVGCDLIRDVRPEVRVIEHVE